MVLTSNAFRKKEEKPVEEPEKEVAGVRLDAEGRGYWYDPNKAKKKPVEEKTKAKSKRRKR